MNKYERNIKQIRDRGESAEMYFLDKTDEECIELVEELGTIKSMVSRGMGLSDIKSTKWYENFCGEIADVLTCIEYLVNLFDIDRYDIRETISSKLDRGYERGKNEE